MDELFHAAISQGEPCADLVYADYLEETGRMEYADVIRHPLVFGLQEVSMVSSNARTSRRIRFRSFSGKLSISRAGTYPRSWSGSFLARTRSVARTSRPNVSYAGSNHRA